MNEPKTLREIGLELGISHQAVTEILERALDKLRKLMQERGIKAQDLLED